MIDEEKYAGWTVYDVIGSAIRNFRGRLVDEHDPEQAVYVCYRRRTDLNARVHCSGFNVNIAHDRSLAHDNELYAFYPGAQFLLAYWANGQNAALKQFPIRIAPLKEARMPLETIYDENGEPAGEKLVPIDRAQQTREKADTKTAKFAEKAPEDDPDKFQKQIDKTNQKADEKIERVESQLQKQADKPKPEAKPTKTA